MSLRIAINTGGGDAPGLNAVIRAVVMSALQRGWEVLGIRKGYQGLLGLANGLIALSEQQVATITHLGGTILGANNRGNPFALPGESGEEDHSQRLVERFHQERLDALVAIGGDGSLAIARDLYQRYQLPVVGVPKTIDNDLLGTDYTFGFDTAVNTATEAIEKLHSTARSHERILVVEVMGRYAGWIALHAGIAGNAHAILLPELPFDIQRVSDHLREREYGIVVVAEGARAAGGELVFQSASDHDGHAPRLGGIARQVALAIAQQTGRETRELVLGHLQRGGQPSAFDRLLSLRYGCAAVQLIERGQFGQMVALQGERIVPVPLSEATRGLRTVPLEGDSLQTARELGICLGDR